MKIKRHYTNLEKLEKQISRLNSKKYELESIVESEETEFKSYIKRHKSLSFENIKSCDTSKLSQIYEYFDEKYPIEWQGGLRNDNRGMKLYYWCYDKGEHLILHLTSDHDNLYFSGSTSWLVYAPTLEDKIEVLKQIKKDMLKILK